MRRPPVAGGDSVSGLAEHQVRMDNGKDVQSKEDVRTQDNRTGQTR